MPPPRRHRAIAHAIFASLALGSVLMRGPLSAQSPSTHSRFLDADATLNRNYQQVLKTLSPSAKEQLRKSERAWLEFVVKNKAAFQAAAPRLGISALKCEEFQAEEFFNRAYQLFDISSSDPTAKGEAAAQLARTDEELNIIYRRCLNSVKEADATRLRDAQRAWIVFRDANRYLGWHLLLTITGSRVEQLNNFYIKTAQTSSRDQEEKREPAAPNPFERAR